MQLLVAGQFIWQSILQHPTPLQIRSSSRHVGPNPFHVNYLGFSPVCGYIPRARIRLSLSLSRYMDMDLNMESVRFIWRYGVIGGGQAGRHPRIFGALCASVSMCWCVCKRWEGVFYLYVLSCACMKNDMFLCLCEK